MNFDITTIAHVHAILWGPRAFAVRCAVSDEADTTTMSDYDHFATFVFALLTDRESMREIEAGLNARHSRHWHAGIRGAL